MQIKQKESANRGRFYMEVDEDIIAEIVYSRSDENTIIIEHTEVNKEYRGKQYGYMLVNETVEFARKEQLKIVPVCQFALAVFERKPAYADVRA